MTREYIGSGHVAARSSGVFSDYFGDGPLLIRSGRRRWFFEFSEMFGPTLLRASDMEPARTQPLSDRDPFWPPFSAWMKSGRRIRPVRDKRGLVRFRLCHYRREDQLE